MRDRLEQGLESFGFQLPATVLSREQKFLEELLHWNRRINLTAIRDPQEALEKHLLDSLFLFPFVETAQSLLDIGSGGGLPGIPLAIAQPRLQVTSVDSVGKKIHFQKHLKRQLQLHNLTPLQTRIEALQQVCSAEKGFDAITARAFAAVEDILILARPWLKAGGQLLLMKGPEGPDELLKAEKMTEKTGLQLTRQVDYQLPFSAAQRTLYLFQRTD